MRTIHEIATAIAEGLEQWLGHDDPCLCVTGESITGHMLSIYRAGHAPMCERCTCGLRDSLIAEAFSSATGEEVLAYAVDPELIADHVREILRSVVQRHTLNQSAADSRE